jgi:hypothetical protein
MISPNTEVRLLSDVPFNVSYEHTRWFTSTTDQTDYFLSKASHTFTQFTYQREEQAVKVPEEYDKLVNVNYIMYKNSNFNDKWFYGFVTRKEYVNPNTTRVYFEIDVFQTYRFEMMFQPSFVEREHCQRWNSDGTPVVNTVDEGLMYGTEYQTVSTTKYKPYNDIYFLVMIAKKRMDNNEVNNGEYYPSINGVPQPLIYYIHPFKLDGTVPIVMVGGEGDTLSPVLDVITAVAKSEDAVNNVVSLYVTDYTGLPMTYDSAYNEWNMSRNNVTYVYINDGSGGTITTLHAFNVPQYNEQAVTFPNIFNDFTSTTESKLLMHPYTVTILDDFKGNRVELKNEYLTGNKLDIGVKGSLGTSNKVAYTVKNYLGRNPMEMALVNNDSNDLPVLSDYLSAFLQGNRNALQNQLNHQLFNGIAGTVASVVGTTAQGKMMGGLGIAEGLTEGVTNIGNAYYETAGIQAKLKDISNVPPSLTKLGGNTNFDFGNGITGLYIIKKEITQEYRTKLEGFFKMYGYKVNLLKIPNLHTRQHFNFVKTVGANIHGDIPNEAISKLKAIFDKGITLWHVDSVYDYSLSNGEI